MGQKKAGAVCPGRRENCMRIIGIVPGAKLFGSEDLYADQYLFVNGYPKRILANGGTPVGILSSDGYAAEDSLSLCDAFVFCGGARFYPYHFQVMEYAAKSGKPVLGICLGMQMMNTYFLVAEEAERRGWDGPLLVLFEQMKKERYMFTEPVDGHWDGHITRDNVERFKHPIHVTPGQPPRTSDREADDPGRVDAQLSYYAPGPVADRRGPDGRRHHRGAGIR